MQWIEVVFSWAVPQKNTTIKTRTQFIPTVTCGTHWKHNTARWNPVYHGNLIMERLGVNYLCPVPQSDYLPFWEPYNNYIISCFYFFKRHIHGTFHLQINATIDSTFKCLSYSARGNVDQNERVRKPTHLPLHFLTNGVLTGDYSRLLSLGHRTRYQAS